MEQVTFMCGQNVSPVAHQRRPASCTGEVAGSYLRLIDSCITQLKAQGPSRTYNESKEEEKKKWMGEWVVQHSHGDPARWTALEATQGQILRQSRTDATSSR